MNEVNNANEISNGNEVNNVNEVNSKKRILLIGINYTPETTGIAPYTAGLARALAEDYDVQVLTTPPHYPAWKIEPEWKKWRTDRNEDGIDVRRLLHYVPAKPTGASRIVSEASFAALVIASGVKKPDVVLTVSPALLPVYSAALIARRYNVPLGVIVQDLYTFAMSEVGLLGGKGGGLVEKIESYALRRATGVAAIHERFAEQINARLGVSSDRTTVIRNWTHISRPTGDRTLMRKRLGWEDDEIVVLHAGNMGAKQGLENVVEAGRVIDSTQQSNKVRFILMGNGNRRAALEAMATDVQSVEFMEPVENEDFSEVLAAADILLLNELPGIAEMCVPSKLTSYFAAGRPVVGASNAKSAAAFEIEASGAGRVVEPGDPTALVNAIREIANADTTAMGIKGQQFAEEQLSESKALSAYKIWVKSLLEA